MRTPSVRKETKVIEIGIVAVTVA
eukprot:COSAG02_NODE_16672_length_1065_cov_1.106625_1_plen_23_part_10